MSIISSLLDFFCPGRIDLDNPLTLLGKDYFKVQGKIYASMHHSVYSNLDRGETFIRHEEEDPNVYTCVWETVKIISTMEHNSEEIIYKAGKIYRDKSEQFIDQISKSFTDGKSRVRGRISHPYYEPEDSDNYYHYDDCTYMNVRKEYDIYDELWTVTIEYIRHNNKPTPKKKAAPMRRSQSEDRDRILKDVDRQSKR